MKQLTTVALLGTTLLGLQIMTAGAATAQPPSYAVTKTIPLPGSVKWDYLTFDNGQNRLFVTRGDSVDVLDTKTDQVTGSIANLDGAHGVALAPDLGKGFITNGKSNNLTVFDYETLTVLGTVLTGTKPDAVLFDPVTQRVFVANGDSSDMTVIDANSQSVLATIKLGGQPEFMVTDGKGRLFINLEDKSQLVTIDIQQLKILARYTLAPACNGPSGLAIDQAQHRLFAVCSNKKLVVVSAKNGKILQTLPIGAHADAVTFDFKGKLAFSSNGEGTLTVIDASNPAHYNVIQTLPTAITARTMALDPETHTLYLSAAATDGFDAPNADHPEARPHVKPDSFMILKTETKMRQE